MGRLDGKVVVITGAAGGIGREASLLFSDEGARVCVADVGREAGEKTASECRDAFFFAAEHQGKALRVHLEQVFSARRQICGVMLLLDPTSRTV